MSEDRIALRQLLAVSFAALLSPAIQLLPGRSARVGEAGWLSALAAAPVALAVCGGLMWLLGRKYPGRGLAEAFEESLGPVPGKSLTFLYLLWCVICLGTNLRFYGQRFLTTSYRNISLGGVMVIALGVALWAAAGKLSAFVRAGEIFYLVVCLTLGIVLFFAAFQVEQYNILPLWLQDLPAAARSGADALGALGHGIFALFLTGRVRWRRGDGRRALRWTLGACLALTVLQAVVMGCFGPALTAEMSAPFFMAAKSVGLRGGFQRIEALVTAVWTLSDLALVGVLIWAGRALLSALLPVRFAGGPAGAAAVAAAGGAVALFAFPDGFFLGWAGEAVLVWGNLLLGFFLPAAVVAWTWLREKGEKRREKKRQI